MSLLADLQGSRIDEQRAALAPKPGIFIDRVFIYLSIPTLIHSTAIRQKTSTRKADQDDFFSTLAKLQQSNTRMNDQRAVLLSKKDESDLDYIMSRMAAGRIDDQRCELKVL